MIFIVNPINIMFLSSYNVFSSNNDLQNKANTSDLGTQCTYSLSGTTLTITPK